MTTMTGVTMTTRRRPQPAQASRILVAGLATASMFGMGASMALATPPVPVSAPQTAATGQTTVIIRRTVQAPSVAPSQPAAATLTETAPRPASPSPSGTVQQPRSRSRGS